MNKLLVLLYFSLIISCSLSKECTEDDCEGQTVDGEKTHYACVPKDDDTCELKLLCAHAVKKGEEETLKCSDFPAQHPSKICINKDDGEACIEDFKCAKVSTLEEEKTCSSYKVSDNSKYLCGDDDTTEANACSKYVLSGATKVTHSCEAAAKVLH
jgi:hypothetical protein